MVGGRVFDVLRPKLSICQLAKISVWRELLSPENLQTEINACWLHRQRWNLSLQPTVHFATLSKGEKICDCKCCIGLTKNSVG